MSLITDLLSKVRKKEPRRDIPPILKDEVLQSKADRRSRRRLMVILILAFLLIAAGFGVIYVVESIRGPSLLARSPATDTPPVQSARTPMAPPPSPGTDTGISASTSGDAKATERAVAPPVQKKDFSNPSRGKIGMNKYAKGLAPEEAGRARSMKQVKTAAGEQTEVDTTRGKMTRHDKDMSLYTARTYEAQKNYRQALLHYKKVLAVEPNNYVVMNNVASMLIYLGSYEEAIRHAEKALTIRRGYVFSLINIGISYGCLGKQSESESYFRKALMIEPSNRFALLNLGLLHEKQEAFNNADQYFRKLSEAGDAQGYLGLARSAEKQKKVEEAIRFYKMALSMENVDSHTSSMVNERLLKLSK